MLRLTDKSTDKNCADLNITTSSNLNSNSLDTIIIKTRSYHNFYLKKEYWISKYCICSRRNSISYCIATKGFALVAISIVAMLMQAYLKQKNIDAKIEQSKHAHIKYEHMLSEIKRYMRDTEFKDHDLIIKWQHIDNEIIESTPNMDK